jgi:conjugative transposon TraN protein
MKKILLTAVSALLISALNAQNQPSQSNKSWVYEKDLPKLYISKDINLHFRSPEPVQFVDLSSDRLIGDLPAENVVRIKTAELRRSKTDSLARSNVPNKFRNDEDLGIITIVGQSFMAQYKIIYKDENNKKDVVSNVEITPACMQPLEYPEFELSQTELKKYAMNMISKPAKNPLRHANDLKMRIELNHVYVVSDYIFLDVSFKNTSNLAYDIDQLKFSIDDKRIYKSTNVQSIDIEPVYRLYNNKKFNRSYRNIYVFKKFTFPNNKILNLRLIENQISGRTISLDIKYKDILQADTF